VRDHRYLRIFLSERVALLHAGVSLAGRMRTTAPDALRDVLDDAARDLAADARTLTSFLRQMGTAPPRLRILCAVAAERAGRLKLNGRLTGRSPLADLEELDGLTVLVAAAATTWDEIAASGVAADDVVAGRAEAHRRTVGRLAAFREERARAALS
jgi:hypothetical protein